MTHQQIENSTPQQLLESAKTSKDIETLASEKITDLANSIPKYNLDTLIERVRDRRKHLDLSPETSFIHSISIQVLALSIAGLAITTPFLPRLLDLSDMYRKLVSVALICLFLIFLSSAWIIVRHAWDLRRRHHFLYLLKIGNQWPFYYYGSDIGRNGSKVLFEGKKIDKHRFFASTLIQLAEKTVREDKKSTLCNEIYQWHLLLHFQAFINQLPIRTANRLFYCLAFSLAGVAAATFILFVPWHYIGTLLWFDYLAS